MELCIRVLERDGACSGNAAAATGRGRPGLPTRAVELLLLLLLVVVVVVVAVEVKLAAPPVAGCAAVGRRNNQYKMKLSTANSSAEPLEKLSPSCTI